MSEPLAVAGSALGGVLAGVLLGWPLGMRARGRPLLWLFYIVGAFVVGCSFAFVEMQRGRVLFADAWLGVAFGAMTAIKYGGGLLPGTGKKAPGTPEPAEEKS